MADEGRKGFTQQVKETAKPESQKSYTEQAGEQLSSGVDRTKGAVMPESEKSAHQQAFDSTRGQKDDAKHGDSLLDKTKDKLGL
ncbi:lipid-binding protein hsp12 [Umbelopsis nana]